MKVLIVCSSNVENFNFAIHQSFIFEQMNAVNRLYPDIRFVTFFIRGKGIYGYLSNLNDLQRKIHEEQIDIVHAHFGLSGLLANLQLKSPVITTFHGTDLNNSINRIISWLAHLLNKRTIVVSQRLKDKIFLLKDKITVLPCGVDFETFYPINFELARQELKLSNNREYILFSSAFSNRIKNYELAKHAISLIHGRDIQILELSGYSRSEVNTLLNACNCAILTSFSEGSPQFIKEAMACNCPIVATDVGDIHEIIGSTEGCYITSFDPEDVAEKIRLALSFGKRTKGRDAIERFDNERIAAYVKNVYDSVIKK